MSFFLFQIERSDRKGRRKISFQAGKEKRSFGVCHDKPVACLPKLRSRFWGFVAQTRCLPTKYSKVFLHERSEFLILRCKISHKKICRTRSDHAEFLHAKHQLFKVVYKCALALLFPHKTST